MRNGIIDRFCPENTRALYEKLVQTSGIRGDISLRQENGNEYILWRVSDALEITAYVEADFGEGYIGIEKYAMHRPCIWGQRMDMRRQNTTDGI